MGRTTQGEKAKVLKELREKGYKLSYLLRAANVSKSIYYFEISKNDVVAERNAVLTQEIQKIFSENKNTLLRFARVWAVRWIINCAGYTAVDKAESDVELAKKLNEDGPANIAKIADIIGARVIHISTDYVFDGTEDIPRTEDMSPAPISIYGITKAAGERAIMDNCENYYILRTSWLYGWAGKNFVYTMIRAMNTHDAVKVVNDQKGTPTFAENLAKVILEIISRGSLTPYGIYHVTDIGEITWWDFTNEIKKQGIEFGLINEMGKKCEVIPCTTDECPTPAKRPAYSVLSKDKIQNALGITLPDWKESLKFFLRSNLFDKLKIE